MKLKALIHKCTMPGGWAMSFALCAILTAAFGWYFAAVLSASYALLCAVGAYILEKGEPKE